MYPEAIPPFEIVKLPDGRVLVLPACICLEDINDTFALLASIPADPEIAEIDEW